MKKILSLIIMFGLTITSLCLLPNNAKGEPITDPSQLKPNPKIIDFEQFTEGYPYTPENNPLVIGDVTFSSVGTLYIRDISDFPANGTEVERNLLDVEPDWEHLWITFAEPVSEVLLGWFDPNFPGNFLRAYDKDNVLLEEVELTDLGPPQGMWATWIGFKRKNRDISKLEVDPAIYPPYDNYGIDNIMYRTIPPKPVPEPSTMLLLGSGLIGLAGYGRKKFFKK